MAARSSRRVSPAYISAPASLGNVSNDLQLVPFGKCAERTIGILYGLELDTGFYHRSLTLERMVSDFSEQLIALMIECEDAKLNDLGRDEFE